MLGNACLAPHGPCSPGSQSRRLGAGWVLSFLEKEWILRKTTRDQAFGVEEVCVVCLPQVDQALA